MAELKDLVQFALDKQPSKFKDAFGELVTARVVDRVDELKAEVAANMFGEAPVSDDDDFEDVDDELIDDEDLEQVDFDEEDIDLEDVDEDDLPEDDDEYVEDEDDIVFDEDEFDDVEESFKAEGIEAIKEETSHYFDSQETRSTSKGLALGVKDRKTGKIAGYLHVGPKVNAQGKRSIFGGHHKMSYSQITKWSPGYGMDHDLGVQKFHGPNLEKQISDIHAKG